MKIVVGYTVRELSHAWVPAIKMSKLLLKSFQENRLKLFSKQLLSVIRTGWQIGKKYLTGHCILTIRQSKCY